MTMIPCEVVSAHAEYSVMPTPIERGLVCLRGAPTERPGRRGGRSGRAGAPGLGAGGGCRVAERPIATQPRRTIHRDADLPDHPSRRGPASGQFVPVPVPM